MAIATEELIKQIDEMTVLELNNLVKALETHYGVSAAATVAVAGGAAAGPAAEVEEKTEFDVVLKAAGDKNTNIGYDVSAEEVTDMVKRGIIDPAKVTRSATENAVSIAGMILTTEALITEVPEKEHQHAPPMPEY